MLSLIHIIDGAALLSFLIAFRPIHRYQRRKRFPYPPGPPGWPLIGNLLDIPPSFPWLVFTEYSKKYGIATLSTRFFSEATCRAHCVIQFSRRKGRRLEQHQSYQRSTREAWGCLLRPFRYAIYRHVWVFERCTLVICLTFAGWNGTGKYQ
jgi:hypothetical protein